MNPDDNILILKLIKEGDRLAFRHLFETWFTPLCRFMHLYIPEKTIVEELTLDLFMHIWENRQTLQIQVSLKAYLFQAARNKCLNELRKQKNTVSLDEISGEIIDAGVYSLEQAELQNLIHEAVLALPDKCREVFYLSRNENLSNREIAEKMNISVKTVEAQITKALKRIKEFLGDAYFYFF
ncbi:MAG: RNA polymerase sigma-70 factor [Paludibacter sp.]|nr:RNA polymerase sigma-70 factor [Paludibacter sp.]